MTNLLPVIVVKFPDRTCRPVLGTFAIGTRPKSSLRKDLHARPGHRGRLRAGRLLPPAVYPGRRPVRRGGRPVLVRGAGRARARRRAGRSGRRAVGGLAARAARADPRRPRRPG
ncbi:hypothetical protein FLW53_38885 [Microbispora sp. SCL1-1]|nr:hypothetical protein FLW53_38885 [Microbispora sp. SCL1-1]